MMGYSETQDWAERDVRALAGGIIAQAAKDYIRGTATLLKPESKNPTERELSKRRTAARRVKEVEIFLKSDWFRELSDSDLPAEEILETLFEMARAEARAVKPTRRRVKRNDR